MGCINKNYLQIILGTAAFPTLNEEHHEDDEVFYNIQSQPAVCYADREWRGETRNAEKMKKVSGKLILHQN